MLGYDQKTITSIIAITKPPSLHILLRHFEEIDQHHVKCRNLQHEVSVFCEDKILNTRRLRHRTCSHQDQGK